MNDESNEKGSVRKASKMSVFYCFFLLSMSDIAHD